MDSRACFIYNAAPIFGGKELSLSISGGYPRVVLLTSTVGLDAADSSSLSAAGRAVAGLTSERAVEEWTELESDVAYLTRSARLVQVWRKDDLL